MENLTYLNFQKRKFEIKLILCHPAELGFLVLLMPNIEFNLIYFIFMLITIFI